MAEFSELWAMYPKKEGKKYAAQCFERLPKADKDAALAALPLHVKKWEIEGRAKQFMPDCSSWLNQARYEDEIELAEGKAVAWWATEQGVLAKGRDVGCMPRPGEDMAQYKARVVNAMRQAA
jgi:hypothetical protein